MKLIFIRHGDPDYGPDCLTEKGIREAKLLADRMEHIPAQAYYVSPLGRARETAQPTMERIGKEAVVCEWMREFRAPVMKPWMDTPHIPWDIYPRIWKADERYFRRDEWYTTEMMRTGNVEEEYRRVTGELDKLLAKHGYVRDGENYRVERPNRDTLVFFCHFGVTCVFLSHLLGISATALWHGTCARTTSLTTVVTEEREEGIAAFRMLEFGNIDHLTNGGEPASFRARFCETYDDFTETH